MNRIELLLQKLEGDAHIEFPGSRRESAKRIIAEWLHQYDVQRPPQVEPVTLIPKAEAVDPSSFDIYKAEPIPDIQEIPGD